MDTFDTFTDGGSTHTVDTNIGHDIANDGGPSALRTSFNGNGDFVIKTPNMVGGHDTFVNGEHTTHTQHNIMGGQDIYHGHHLAQTTIPNVEGGIDVFDGSMHPQGSFFPDGIGGENYLSLTGNADSIMNFQDPLVHAADLHMNPFNVAAYK